MGAEIIKELYHAEEIDEYLNLVLPNSSNSFKYLYLKKRIMKHFILSRNGYNNRISAYTEVKKESFDKLCQKIAEEYGTTEKTWTQLAKENNISISTIQFYIHKYEKEHPGYFSQKPGKINKCEITNTIAESLLSLDCEDECVFLFIAKQ